MKIKLTATNKNIWKNIWPWVMLLPIFLYIWLVSFLTPMMVDDLQMGVHSRGDFFNPSLVWEHFLKNYFNESGRIGILFWCFALLSFGRVPFDENGANFILAGINGAIFVLFLWLCYIMAFGRRPNFLNGRDRLNWCWLFLLSMVVVARKGETYFWISGYVMYLWSITLLLAFVVFYRLVLVNKTSLRFEKNSWQEIFFTLAIVVIGFFAGMTTEIGGIIAIGLLSVIMGYKMLVARQPLPRWCCIGMVAFVIGYVVLMAAPGNYVRLNDPLFDIFKERTFAEKLMQIPHMIRLFITRIRWVSPIIFVIGFYYWQKNIKVAGKEKNFVTRLLAKMAKDKLFAVVVVVAVATLGAVAAIAFSPVKDGRVFFLATVLFMISFLLVIDYLWASGRIKPRIKTYLGLAAVLFMVYYLPLIARRAYQYHVAFQAQEDIIKQQKDKGLKDIVVPNMNLKTRFWIHDGSIRSTWVSKVWADYYGLSSIRMVE